jgi:hypothetical protein
VPIERQKLMAKGAWVGTLKDDADLEKMNIKENQQILLMGTADVIAAPTAQVQFVEDLTEEQKAEKGTVNPSGLQNLGNTCYMNSTVECLCHMLEMREAFDRVAPTGPAENFTVALRETFNALDRCALFSHSPHAATGPPRLCLRSSSLCCCGPCSLNSPRPLPVAVTCNKMPRSSTRHSSKLSRAVCNLLPPPEQESAI